MSTWEYAVAIRRQHLGRPGNWELWTSQGKIHEEPGFLALMNWAGAQGFEAYAAGDFDEVGVPEVLLKRSRALPPVPVPRESGATGADAKSPGADAARPRRTARVAKSKESKS